MTSGENVGSETAIKTTWADRRHEFLERLRDQGYARCTLRAYERIASQFFQRFRLENVPSACAQVDARVEYSRIGTKEPEVALSIKDLETERLAKALAEKTGETITMATRRALEERLRRLANAGNRDVLLEELAASRRRWAKLPVLDNRSADEILGYDENGLPN
jgi:antitoxin VapB